MTATMGADQVQIDRIDRERAGAYGWFVVVALTVVNLVSSIDRFLMGIVLVPLKGAMALTDAQLGLVYGLGFAILYCVAGIPFGWLTNYFNRSLAIICGCILWTVATAACAFTTTFGQLFAARIAVGLGEAVLVPAAISLINAYIPKDRLGIANGMFFSGSSMGKAAAFIGGGILLMALAAQGGLSFSGMRFEPWQGLFLFAAFPGLLALVLMIFVRDPPRPKIKENLSFKKLTEYVGRERLTYLGLVLGACMLNLSAITIAGWTPSFFVRSFNLDIAHAGTLVGIIGITAGISGAITGGILADRLAAAQVRGATAMVIAGSLLISIPAAICTFLMAPSVLVAAISYFVLQFVVLVSGPQCFAAIQHVTPREHRGFTASVLLAVVMLVAMGFGPFLIGTLSDSVFNETGSPLGWSMAVSIALQGLIGTVAYLTVRHRFHDASVRIEQAASVPTDAQINASSLAMASDD